MLSSECDETVVYGVRQKLGASKKPTEALRLPGTPQKDHRLKLPRNAPPHKVPPPLNENFSLKFDETVVYGVKQKLGGVRVRVAPICHPLPTSNPLTRFAPPETSLARYYRCSFRHLILFVIVID